MATVNLGKIKLKWRGTWSSGGSYTADDVVEYTDGSVTSSFIAVASSSNQAPSSGGTVNTTYWNLAAKGQATSPTTTQGDLIVRGASADERLAIGAAGKALKVNSSGNGLEYGSGGGLVQTKFKTITAATSVSTNTTYVNPSGFSHTITPTSASNHIIVTFNVCYSSTQQYGSHRITRTVSGGSEVLVPGSVGDQVSGRRQGVDGNNYYLVGDTHAQSVIPMTIIDKTHNTTNAITYKLLMHSYNGTYQFNYNRSSADADDSYSYRGISTITLQEVLPTS